ncbi:MAG TPA: hypothetical protein VIX18_01940 [Nitrospirota bacterium]
MKDALTYVNRAVRITLFLAALGLVASCATHQPFVLFDDKTVIKPGSIAVITADGSEATMWLAEALTRELRDRSTFKVWSQAKIGLRIGRYPVTIKQGQPETPDKPVWFGKGEKAKVDAMQSHLKVHYVFVVWAGFSRTGTSGPYDVSMNGNVVEYPQARVIGYSHLTGSSPSTKGDDVKKMLKDAAAKMADAFIGAAKAEKAEKPGKTSPSPVKAETP